MRLILTNTLLILGNFLFAQTFNWEQIEEIGLTTVVDAPIKLEDRGEGFVRIAGRQDDWDETTAMWMIQDSLIYTNNVEGQVTERLELFFDGTIWVNSERTTYEYENDQQTKILREYWAAVEWVPLSQTIYEYNGDLLLSFYIQDWIY